MANVIYNSNRIIPAPFVSVTKNYSNEAYKYGRQYEITIQGKILPNKGSPNAAGSFWTSTGFPPDDVLDEDEHFQAMAKKVMSLQQLFMLEGAVLEFQPSNGAVGLKCNPRIKSMSFPEGPWYNISDYSVVFEADDLYDTEDLKIDGDSVVYIKQAAETWQVELSGITSGVSEAKYYIVTHTISATGVRHYEPDGSVAKEAWERAKDFAVLKAGRDNIVLSKLLIDDLSGKTEFLNSKSENIDEVAGTYTYTESFTFTDSAAYTESFTVTKTSGSGGLTVTVNGEIRGLDALSTNKYANALTGFSEARIYSRAQTYSGETLNSEPLNKSVGRAVTDGLITYNYEYNNRPSTLVTGSLSESINFTYDDGGDVFAEIFVLGRAAGPVLQDLSTITSKRLSVEIDVLMPPGSTMPNVTSYINSFDPGGFANPPQRSWNPSTGNFRHAVSWTYT